MHPPAPARQTSTREGRDPPEGPGEPQELRSVLGGGGCRAAAGATGQGDSPDGDSPGDSGLVPGRPRGTLQPRSGPGSGCWGGGGQAAPRPHSPTCPRVPVCPWVSPRSPLCTPLVPGDPTCPRSALGSFLSWGPHSLPESPFVLGGQLSPGVPLVLGSLFCSRVPARPSPHSPRGLQSPEGPHLPQGPR